MTDTPRSVVITGASAGIGAAIARVFLAEGDRVGVLDLDIERAKVLVTELGDSAYAIQVDVRKRASLQAAFDQVVSEVGGIDVLCANAGVSTMQHALELTDEDWELNMDVNARGVFLANQLACRHFTSTNRQGIIINTASLAGKVGAPLLAHYSASKFAVLGWTQALAKEMAPHGIRVNAVCPGFVRTGMQEREIQWEARLRNMSSDEIKAEYISLTPLGRLEEPEDVADVVRFLASNDARFMTGQGINITGGVRMD